MRIITVQPDTERRHYVINLDCQKTALQVLKEITRTNISFDNPTQLAMMIERLKVELAILKDDYDGYNDRNTPERRQKTWLPLKYDDSPVQSHTMAKR